MTEEGLLTIITPCHNSAPYVGRLLDSILLQDYPSVEVIAVDDDSSDSTAEILAGYIPSFQSRGYVLKVLRQHHQGQSGAINNALKMVAGEYLVWPDSDDFYSEQRSLSKMIDVLESAPAGVGCVRCLPSYVDEQLQPLLPGNGVPRRLNPEEEWLFHDSIWGHNGFWYLSGGYIVRMSAFDRCIRDREIACAKNAGQSWQLLLPIFYRYRCLTVPEKLHTVVVRRDSHSRNYYNTYASLLGKHRDFEYVLLKTIERIEGMPQAERDALLREVREHYAKEHYLTAVRYGIRKEIRRTYCIIRKDYPGRMSAVEKLSGLLAWLACPESVIILSLKFVRRYYAWRGKK